MWLGGMLMPGGKLEPIKESMSVMNKNTSSLLKA